jgi:hypothetical protein
MRLSRELVSRHLQPLPLPYPSEYALDPADEPPGAAATGASARWVTLNLRLQQLSDMSGLAAALGFEDDSTAAANTAAAGAGVPRAAAKPKSALRSAAKAMLTRDGKDDGGSGVGVGVGGGSRLQPPTTPGKRVLNIKPGAAGRKQSRRSPAAIAEDAERERESFNGSAGTAAGPVSGIGDDDSPAAAAAGDPSSDAADDSKGAAAAAAPGVNPVLGHALVVGVNLSVNRLTAIRGLSGAMAELSGRLQVLDLSRNLITGLEQQLTACVQLRALNLSTNALTAISGLDGCPLLEVLDLSMNRITAISGLDKLTQLHTLSIYGNQLTELQGTRTQSMPCVCCCAAANIQLVTVPFLCVVCCLSPLSRSERVDESARAAGSAKSFDGRECRGRCERIIGIVGPVQ